MNLIPLKPYGLKTVTLNHSKLNKVISLIVSCLRSKNNESYLF